MRQQAFRQPPVAVDHQLAAVSAAQLGDLRDGVAAHELRIAPRRLRQRRREHELADAVDPLGEGDGSPVKNAPKHLVADAPHEHCIDRFELAQGLGLEFLVDQVPDPVWDVTDDAVERGQG